MESDRDKWNARYADPLARSRGPDAYLVSLDSRLPRQGKALDIAGGAGRNAVWLARRGLDVTLVDISEMGLRQARAAAAAAGVSLDTVLADLDSDPLLAAPWDLLVSIDFLWLPLFALAADLLAPGGMLVYVQPTRKNLERHASPNERFLLDDGSLPGLLRGLEILHFEEGWTAEGRHEARLLAGR